MKGGKHQNKHNSAAVYVGSSLTVLNPYLFCWQIVTE